MSELLFYKNVVPLNSETHRDLHLKAVKKPLAFAKEANLIPALVDEFEFAMDDLPIAFLPGKEQPSAVFVAGLEPGSSVFITEDVTNALALAQNYRAAADRTDEFAKKLNTLKLLRDIKLDAKMPDGSEKSVHGLQVLDEEAFAALPAKALGELHKAGFLKAIYSHLFSLRSVPKLISGAEPAGK